MSFSYVIEHMEEDEDTSVAIPPWVQLEYKHMGTLAGPSATLYFTHLSEKSCQSLESSLNEQPACAIVCSQKGVTSLMNEILGENSLDQVCLLDPKAPLPLSPEDGDGKFKWFLFGGILGDDPPRDRTSELRALGFPGRNLGSVQMTTDTALGVTKVVVADKVPLDQIKYVDFPTIVFNAKESVEMPFRYIADAEGKPILPPGMREHLKEDLNKSFDF